MFEDKRPALVVLVFALLAAIISCFSNVVYFIVAMALLLAAAVFAAIYNKIILLVSFLVGIAVLAQAITIQLCAVNKLEIYDAKNVEICGTFCTSHTAGDGYVSQILKVSQIDGESVAVPIKIQLINTNGFIAKQGDKATILASLDVSQGTAYQNINFSQGIYASARNYKIITCESNKNIYSVSGDVKAFVKRTIEHYLPYDEATLLTAIVIGDRVNIDDSFYNDAVDSGVTHMMVVSGMHLGIICYSLIKLLRRIMSNRLAALLVLPFVMFVSIVCDFGYSIIRAAISYLIFLVGSILLKRSDPLSSLCIAVVAILVYNPFALFSASLLLSATSTAGILIVSVPLTDKIKPKFKNDSLIFKIIISAFCTTLGATLFSLPVSMLLFGRVSVLGIITNVLSSYAVTVALCAAVSAIVLCAVLPIQPIVNLLFSVTGICIKYFCAVVRFIANFKFASVDVTHAYAVFCSVLFVIVAHLCAVLTKRGKNHILKRILAVALVPFVILTVYLNTSRTEIVAVKLKKSQSVIISSRNYSVVIGSGGNLADSKRVNDALKELNIKKIDALYIINPNESFAGANYLINNNQIAQIFTSQSEDVQNKLKQLCDKVYPLFENYSFDTNTRIKCFDGTVYVDIGGYSMFIGNPQDPSPIETFCYQSANVYVYTEDGATCVKIANNIYKTELRNVRAKIKNDYALISK